MTKLQLRIRRANDDSGNREMAFLFCLRKLSLKPRYLGIFFYLCLCKKLLQARYLFALFEDYLRLNGIGFIHVRLQWQIFINWVFYGCEWRRVILAPNVKSAP